MGASPKRKTKKKSPTRGWKKASPKLGSQRRAMLKKCGKKCFLSLSNLKFPICRSNCVEDFAAAIPRQSSTQVDRQMGNDIEVTA